MKWGRSQMQATPVMEMARSELPGLSSEELTRIFLEMRPSLERVIQRRINDVDTAQDLAQDIYLRLDRIAEVLPAEDDARRYLMRMAVHAALYHQRSQSRHVQLLAGALAMFEGHVAEPDEHAHAHDRMAIIEQALTELPAKCRDVLYLTRIEGLPREEVAQRLGVSLSLVNKYVLLALKHCQKKLCEG